MPLINPAPQHGTAWITERFAGEIDAASMVEKMIQGSLLLRDRVLRRTVIPLCKLASPIVLPVPALQRVLGRITQLPNGRLHPLAQLDIELDCADLVFVRVHELPPGSPSSCPHPRVRRPILTMGARSNLQILIEKCR